jgi:hypothetical protein
LSRRAIVFDQKDTHANPLVSPVLGFSGAALGRPQRTWVTRLKTC